MKFNIGDRIISSQIPNREVFVVVEEPWESERGELLLSAEPEDRKSKYFSTYTLMCCTCEDAK